VKRFVWAVLFLCSWPLGAQHAAVPPDAPLLRWADVLFRRGENQEALATYRRARQAFSAAGDRDGEGYTWRGEADVLFRLGDNQAALDAYRKARQLFTTASDRLGQGSSWRGEANVLFRLGENQQALDAFRTARQLFVEVGSRIGQGNTWRGEADVLVLLDAHQQALDAYRKARQLFSVAGDRLGEGTTWLGEADVLFRFGERREAIAAYRSARQLFAAVGDRLGQGNAWKGEADVLFRLGESQAALDAYRTAREHFSTVGSRLGQGNTWKGEADVLLLQGEEETALAAYRNARQLFAAVGDRLGQGNTWLGEARILHRRRAWRQAAEAAATAIASFESTGVVLNRIPTFLLKAEAEDRAGDPAAAIVSASAAIRLHSQWRQSWMTDRDRTDREWTISRAYDLLVPLRARQADQAAEALRLAEEARSRVLLDLLATGPRSAAQEQFLTTAPPLDTAAIQALARETGPLLLYYAAEREVWGFLILPGTDEIVLRRIDLAWRELGREVRSLEHDLANPLYEPRAAARAHQLWDLLIAPFGERLPAQGPLVLVPHGPLHELPFEALLDPAGRPLFERWQVSVTPSVSALDFARRRHAAPSPGDSFLALSFGEDSASAEIAGLFKAAFGPTQAGYQDYEKLVARTRHLLIATRGVHTEGSRTDTYLEIQSTPKVHDSRLTADEIAAIPLAAELVTLAACDTSHGQALLSDERLDLTRSFLIAGAAAVLATRWKVPEDASTSRFLADFYRAYRRGSPQGTGLRKDEALSEARDRSRERGDPAQVWAAWVLIGDAR
jgi:CHAT domain-containing protein/predicted negative regulator of RcsB-dependent stress response